MGAPGEPYDPNQGYQPPPGYPPASQYPPQYPQQYPQYPPYAQYPQYGPRQYAGVSGRISLRLRVSAARGDAARTATAAAVLGYVTAGLLIAAGLLLFFGASIVDDFDFNNSQSVRTTEYVLDGILNLVAGGLLIAGGVSFSGRNANGRILLSVGCGHRAWASRCTGSSAATRRTAAVLGAGVRGAGHRLGVAGLDVGGLPRGCGPSPTP